MSKNTNAFDPAYLFVTWTCPNEYIRFDLTTGAGEPRSMAKRHFLVKTKKSMDQRINELADRFPAATVSILRFQSFKDACGYCRDTEKYLNNIRNQQLNRETSM